MRSFGDARDEKRQRFFLTRGAGNMMDPLQILQIVKDGLEQAMITPCVGWENIYNLPDDSMVIMSADLHYLFAPSFLRFVEQMVVVSKVRVIITLKAQLATYDLKIMLTEYNADHRDTMVRKILKPDGGMMYNLQDVRPSLREWVRPRHLPPPLPGDIAGVLEGASLGELEVKLEEFLQGAIAHMRNMGFCEPPFGYVPPRVILQRGREGRVERQRFFLSWARQEHALAFFTIWNGYHWGSNHYEQVIVVALQNGQWEEAVQNPALARIRADPMQASPATFLQMMGGNLALRGP